MCAETVSGSSTTRPSRIRIVREQTAAASGLCVIMMIVWLNFSFSSLNISSTICEFSRIEISGRFVGQDDRRAVDDRTCKRDTLLLTARQLERLMMHLIFELQEPQNLAPSVRIRAAVTGVDLFREF